MRYNIMIEYSERVSININLKIQHVHDHEGVIRVFNCVQQFRTLEVLIYYFVENLSA